MAKMFAITSTLLNTKPFSGLLSNATSRKRRSLSLLCSNQS